MTHGNPVNCQQHENASDSVMLPRTTKHKEYAVMLRDIDRSLWAYCDDKNRLVRSEGAALYGEAHDMLDNQ